MGWVKCVFHSSLQSSRNGIMILVNKGIFTLQREIKDTEGRVIRVQALIEGLQVILCNIYAPNKGDPIFFFSMK